MTLTTIRTAEKIADGYVSRPTVAAQQFGRTPADAYEFAAEWHDKQAASCDAIAKDEPRIDAVTRERAADAAKHHRSSAAGLRLAAINLLRII